MSAEKTDLEKLEEEIKAEEAAAQAASVKTDEVPPEPTVTEPETKATPEPNAEVEDLKRKLQEKDERITELTRRVNAEDGRRGGELNALRQQVASLTEQINRMNEVKASVPAAPVKDEFQETYPEVAEHVRKDTGKLKAELDDAKRTAEEARKLAIEDRQARFLERIAQDVPNFAEINDDPKFAEFCDTMIPESPDTRRAVIARCQQSLDPRPVVAIFKAYLATQKKPDAPAPVEKKQKPEPKDQVAIAAAAGSEQVAPKKPASPQRRIKELEDKMYVLHLPLKKEEMEEYERLVAADAGVVET